MMASKINEHMRDGALYCWLMCVVMLGMVACTPPVAVEPPAPPPTPATPHPRRLAPDGVFFLIEYVSIETPDGISGIKPGTTVTRIQESGEKMRVKAGLVEVDVKRSQLTNDLDIAARAGALDARAQQLLALARAREGDVAIFSATYGSGTAIVDVTHQVRAELAKGNYTIRVGSHLAGRDPAWGQVKTLRIEYSIAGGPTVTATAREGEHVTIGQPQVPPQVSASEAEIRYIQVPKGTLRALDRGAYDQKQGVARPPQIYDQNGNRIR